MLATALKYGVALCSIHTSKIHEYIINTLLKYSMSQLQQIVALYLNNGKCALLL